MLEIDRIKIWVKDFFHRADIFLLVMCTICALFSLWAVSKAVTGMAAGGWDMSAPAKYIVVQGLSIVIGLVAFVVFTIIDADLLGQQWKLLWGVIIALLVALIIFGQDDGTGNKAWIRFAGIGIQPSEFIKIIYIIISARHMTYLKEYHDISSFWSILQMGGHFMLVFAPIFVISSDLGSGMILVFVFLIMIFAAGVKLYWFGVGGAAVAAMVPLLWTYFFKDYQKQRIIAPYDPSIDPTGYGITWQTTQSKLTLASGRLTGVEEGYTPSVFTGKHTDFIFSCIGENLGMIGCIAVMAMLTIIMVHCVKIGLQSGRTFDMLLCIGIAGAMAFQTFINIGMCIGITPVIGITLPFFSYGGSSMVTMYAAMGIISGVKYKPKPERFSLIY